MIYLASPYSHPDKAIRIKRYCQVSQLTVKLLQLGHNVFCPIAYSHHLADDFGLSGAWEFWEKFDLAFIDRCDEIWVHAIPGWRESIGVQAELKYARSKNMPIRYVDCATHTYHEPEFCEANIELLNSISCPHTITIVSHVPMSSPTFSRLPREKNQPESLVKSVAA